MNSIVKDWRSVQLDPIDHALCKFAVKVTRSNSKASPEDIESFRKLGLSDRAIHDAVQVISYFNYITRIADALGVEPYYKRRWG